jgi:transcriptional regulator with XRE-family HTH domain
MTIGERVAWYRRRRGMSQEVLAGLVDRTVDWLSKAENGRIELDRLSVVRTLADALDVTLGDLLGEPTILEWTADSGPRTIPALRESLLDYRQVTPLLPATVIEDAPSINELSNDVARIWDAYQASRYGLVTSRLPVVVRSAQAATARLTGDEQLRAFALLGLAYQATTLVLTKLGETDLAWIAAERGFTAVQRSGDEVAVGALFRSVVHALQSTGRYREATKLTVDGVAYLDSGMAHASADLLSVYGTLLLAGSVAAARDEDRATANAFLAAADKAAQRLGYDGNHMWTAFGPTNVAIHRVAAAVDLGDVQVAIELAPRVDTTALPVERRVRHSMELARALSSWNRTDQALTVLLDAEQVAPEQVRHHAISRQLVQNWIKRSRGKPGYQLAALAHRVHVA